MEFKIEIHGDSDGYIKMECQYCRAEFLLNAGELQDEEFNYTELFCPYCGLADEVSRFY